MDLLELQREAAALPPNARRRLVYFLVSLDVTDETDPAKEIREKIDTGLEDIRRGDVLDAEQTREAMSEGKRLWKTGTPS